MPKLKQIRELRNLTQEELAELSGISVRTIQRIESGSEPKGQTLKILAKALEVTEPELLSSPETEPQPNFSLVKIINISSLPFSVLPPINIAVPLVIMLARKRYDPIIKQLISIQILWTVLAVIIFILTAFIKNWLGLSGKFSLMVMVALILTNVFIILRNTAEIDRKGKLYFQLGFNII